jgi:hypothetical protein
LPLRWKVKAAVRPHPYATLSPNIAFRAASGIAYSYGLITSLGYRYTYISIGGVVIFDINSAIKLNPDTYIIEEKTIIAKFVQEKEKKQITPIEEVFGSEGIL